MRDWEPPVQITPEEYSEAELDRYYQDRLQENASSLEVSQPPDVSLMRWSMGSFEYAANMASCLQEAGFPAVAKGRHYVLDPGVPSSQLDSLNLASYACSGKYMIYPLYSQGWSKPHVGIVYDYWVEYYIPCMRAHGYNIQDDDKPSREAYVSAFNTMASDCLAARLRAQPAPLKTRQRPRQTG